MKSQIGIVDVAGCYYQER